MRIVGLSIALIMSAGLAAAAPAKPMGAAPVCYSTSRIIEAARANGFATQTEMAEGHEVTLIQTQQQNTFAIAEVANDQLGCVGILFAAPFGADNGTYDKIYNQFNKPENGFIAIAGNLGGQVALARFSVSKHGFVDGNVAFDILLFSHAIDTFKPLVTGISASNKVPLNPNALAGTSQPANTADFDKTYRAMLGAIAAKKPN